MTCILLILPVISILNLQAQDTEYKDAPYFTGMPNYIIDYAEDIEFDNYHFFDGTKCPIVEGKKFLRQYVLKEGATQASQLQIVRNYSNALKSIGGTVFIAGLLECAECDNDGMYLMAGKVIKNGNEVWVEVLPGKDGFNYRLTEVIKGVMKQDINAIGISEAVNLDSRKALPFGDANLTKSIAPNAGSITETDPVWSGVSSDYYTKSNLQTEGEAMILFANLTQLPTTLAGYKIKDAVDIKSDQTVEGIKIFTDTLIIKGHTFGKGGTFAKDLIINGVTVGRGRGSVETNTSIGKDALYSNTPGNNNTAIGAGALLANIGSNNTANGYMALYSNVNGVHNTANGANALASNIHGHDNTGIGSSALYNNTEGYRNTAIGSFALDDNTVGNNNTAIGSLALNKNTTGNFNTAIGPWALYKNTTGNRNTAIGYYSIYSNTTGSKNTAIGDSTLSSNTTGSENISIGYGALSQNATGFNNMAIGVDALYANTTGNHSTSIGNKALGSNTTGNYNTAIGYYALRSNTIGNNNMAIGNFSLQHNTEGVRNTAIGNSALKNNTDGIRNTAIGAFALTSQTTGERNTVIGAEADVALSPSISNATAIGYAAVADASNKVRIGNADVKVIEGQVNWSVASDLMWIENLEYSDQLGLNFVKGLKTATFNYKNDSTKKLYNGLIAQDVQAVLRKLELSFSGLTENDNQRKTLNLSYAEFVIPLINAIQEQQKQIEELKIEIALLKSKDIPAKSGEIR